LKYISVLLSAVRTGQVNSEVTRLTRFQFQSLTILAKGLRGFIQSLVTLK